MKLFFEPTPTYCESIEATLPGKDDLIKYFLHTFYPEYRALSNRVKEAYKIRDKNLRIFYGEKGRVVQTSDTKNYPELHDKSIKLGEYYKLLLTATKRKYNIWLNDFLPK